MQNISKIVKSFLLSITISIQSIHATSAGSNAGSDARPSNVFKVLPGFLCGYGDSPQEIVKQLDKQYNLDAEIKVQLTERINLYRVFPDKYKTGLLFGIQYRNGLLKHIIYQFNQTLYAVNYNAEFTDTYFPDKFELNSAEFRLIQDLPLNASFTKSLDDFTPAPNVWYSMQEFGKRFIRNYLVYIPTRPNERLTGCFPTAISLSGRVPGKMKKTIDIIHKEMYAITGGDMSHDEFRQMAPYLPYYNQGLFYQVCSHRYNDINLKLHYIPINSALVKQQFANKRAITLYCRSWSEDFFTITQEFYNMLPKDVSFELNTTILKYPSALGIDDIFVIQAAPVNAKHRGDYAPSSPIIIDQSCDSATANSKVKLFCVDADAHGALRHKNGLVCFDILMHDGQMYFYYYTDQKPLKKRGGSSTQTIETFDPAREVVVRHSATLPRKDAILYSSPTCDYYTFDSMGSLWRCLHHVKICRSKEDYIVSPDMPHEIDGEYFVGDTKVTMQHFFRLIHSDRVEYYFKRVLPEHGMVVMPEVLPDAGMAAAAYAAAGPALEVLRLPRNNTEPYIAPLEFPLGFMDEEVKDKISADDTKQNRGKCVTAWDIMEVKEQTEEFVQDVKKILERNLVLVRQHIYDIPKNPRLSVERTVLYNQIYSTIFTSLIETVYTNTTRINGPVTLGRCRYGMSKEDFVRYINRFLGSNILVNDIFQGTRHYENPVVQVIVRKGNEVTDREVFLVVRKNESDDRPIGFKFLPRGDVEPVEVEYVG